MFNPKNLTQKKLPTSAGGQRIVIEKSNDKNKSRWDEPFIIPLVLYRHFKVPIPQSQSKKQTKSYPIKLIDYIKKAYEQCCDDSEKRIMEGMLRKVISQNESRINEIAWEKQPIPLIAKPESKRLVPKVTPTIVKKQKVINNNVVNNYQLQQNEQIGPPSKNKIKALKTLQKFEEKLKKTDKEQENNTKKVFIGFKSEPQTKLLKPPNAIKMPPPQNNYLPTKELTISFPPPQKKQTPEIKQSISKPINNKKQTSVGALKQLQKRFTQFNKLKMQENKVVVESQDDYDDVVIVGKSTSMEKRYLRITGRPDPETVRPQHILKKVLTYLLKKYKEGATYDYMLEQLKSLRQDLTVQHIRNKLTVRVYQQNLKISLFENDRIQSKQCLSNLWQLYRQGIYDDLLTRDIFVSYQLLTLIMEEKYRELQYMLTLLPTETLEHPQIQQALKLKRGYMLGNYRAFFDFYANREQVCRCLLNQYIDKVRMKWLLMVCKTFRQKVSLKILAQIISQDQDILQALIVGEGGIVRQNQFILKESIEAISKSQHLVVKTAHLSLD